MPVSPVPDAWAWDEDATRNEMLLRLDGAIEKLRRTGARVEGTIGCDRDAMVCVNFVMSREPFDEVLVATPRTARARVIRMDLAARIRRAFGVPVTYVPAAPAPGTPSHGLGFSMKIAVAADERTGVADALADALRERGHEPIPHGALNDDERDDWAWASEAAARDVAEGRADRRSCAAGRAPARR